MEVVHWGLQGLLATFLHLGAIQQKCITFCIFVVLCVCLLVLLSRVTSFLFMGIRLRAHFHIFMAHTQPQLGLSDVCFCFHLSSMYYRNSSWCFRHLIMSQLTAGRTSDGLSSRAQVLTGVDRCGGMLPNVPLLLAERDNLFTGGPISRGRGHRDSDLMRRTSGGLLNWQIRGRSR